jgi:Icc-related predicted phosphoesterase
MHWIVLSDLHEHTANLRRLAHEIAAAEVVVLSGDLTMFGGREHAARVLDEVRALNPRVLAVPGNTDHRDVLPYLEAEGVSLHGRAVEIHGVVVYGVGGANPTPFGTPFELAEDEILEHLDRAASTVDHAAKRIVVSHAPPFESGVDRLWSGRPVGSRAVREHVERTRPDLVLSGHIHEGRGTGNVGAVPVVNPGPFVAGGYVRITFATGQPVASYERIPLGRADRVLGEVKQAAHKLRRLPNMRTRR